MFFCYIFIICFFDFASLFPVQNCNTQFKRLLAVLDCRGDIDEQRNFIQTLSDYLQSNHRMGKVELKINVMMEDKCKWTVVNYIKEERMKYKEIIPIPLILNTSKVWKESEDSSCTYLSASFIFLFNITDINNNSNTIIKEILDSVNESKTYNIFFIIQTFENVTQTYNTIDFIYFASSFKGLKIEYIVNKICDFSVDNKTLLYSSRRYVQTDYRIVNQLSEISSFDIYCFCSERLGMKILSLESYDEFVDVIQFINNVSILNNTKGMNLFLIFTNSITGACWVSGNPYTFSNSSRIVDNECFYLNLSSHTDTIVYQDKSLYNLGKYMVEIDCYKPLQYSLVVCESDNFINFFPDTHNEPINNKPISAVTNKVNLIHDETKFILDMFYFFADNGICNCEAFECVYKNTIFSSLNEEYWCTNNSINIILNEINNAKNTFITNLYKSTDSMYSLKQIDISECKNYNECQSISQNATYSELSNPMVDNFCVDDTNNTTFNDNCSIRTLNLSFNEYFQCESNKSQYSLKCIKDYNTHCEDNSNLRNCDKFICPEPFIKCFNSYCIFPEMINNVNNDCPYGEDEIIETKKFGLQKSCFAHFLVNIRDLCLDLKSYQDLMPIIDNNSRFVCNNVCPTNHICVSGKIEENFSNKRISRVKYRLFHISSFIQLKDGRVKGSDKDETFLNSHLFMIVSLRVSKCSLRNFDYQLQYKKLQDMIVLDVSFNQINHSNYLKSVQQFSKLKLLNLSHNENLIIDELFNFPRSLEIIDLAYTKTKTFKYQVFGDLINLRHLDISHTLITRFKDMGLPKYFTLDNFYIQEIKIQKINKDFFKGLTINSELIASDYVICCPQVLNTNISVDKCHAPIDFISSCKHLLGDTFKRVIIWLVGFLTLVGNGIVLIYRLGWNRQILKKAYGLFIIGLAISDIFMGIYLIIIAIADAYYKDVYFLEDLDWRHGFICNVCGLLSTLSSEASTFFICLITVDRYFCITYPFGEHGFSKTCKYISFTFVWFTAFVLALIPVVFSDWEIYSSNGLCLALPFSPTQNKGWIFSFVIFVAINFVLFLLIGFGQLAIFISLIKVKKSISSVTQNNESRSEEWSVAKKLAFVAFTDFCCWFPVGILGLISINGYIFNREVYAWIAVFILPINSALNPIIYTIPAVYKKYKQLF